MCFNRLEEALDSDWYILSDTLQSPDLALSLPSIPTLSFECSPSIPPDDRANMLFSLYITLYYTLYIPIYIDEIQRFLLLPLQQAVQSRQCRKLEHKVRQTAVQGYTVDFGWGDGGDCELRGRGNLIRC